MNLDALPYTSFIVLMEFSVGSLVVAVLADWRGACAVSFIKFSAAMVMTGAAVMLLNALALDPRSVIGGYELDDGLLRWVQALSAAFLAASIPYVWATLREDRAASMAFGTGAIGVGVALVGAVSWYISVPTWGFAGVFLSLAAGTLAVGAVVLAMTLGHWYLTVPRLSRQPLEEMTLLLLAAIVLQAALLALNVAIPARDTPEATAFLGSTTLGANPAFWLRIAIGLAFPAALAWMSHVSSRGYPENAMAMMSATGLLYIAVGAVVVGEVLARGLLFLTAVAV